MMALPSCHSGYRWRHRRPNEVLAQRLEERQIPRIERDGRRMKTHKPGLVSAIPKPCKAEDSGAAFALVRSIDFPVQIVESGDGAPMAALAQFVHYAREVG
jgi:hypothetical protein